MAGFNVETYLYKNITASGQNLSDEYLNDLSLVTPDDTGATVTSVTGGQSEYALMGFFGRINYDYQGRYMAEANLRYDGSSRFIGDKQWGFFPSTSLGWNVAREDFWQNWE